MEKNMHFYGCDAAELAKEFGTPLYVISEDYVRERCREVRSSFTEKYENTRAVYASKALQTLELCKIIESEGLGFDVVSGGEIYAALKAGVDPSKMVFHGNSKSPAEIKYALESKIGTIVVDNLSELEILDKTASTLNCRPSILLRVTPGVDSHTHQYISTGQLDSKFGFSIDEVIDVAARQAMESPNVDFKGFHYHIGSQLHDNTSHLLAADIMLKMLKDVKEKYGFTASEINCGGGFGVHYKGDPERSKISYFMDPVMEKITSFYKAEGDKRPLITIEPGRWIVSEGGITIYEIDSVKTNAAGRTYYGVDGGMSDNPRTALYEASYEVEAVEKYGMPHDKKVNIAGKCCESDVLVWDAMLPELKPGDHIAVLCTGAYNYSMASNYNRLPRPALVMIKDGNAHLSVRRETYEDLIEREL